MSAPQIRIGDIVRLNHPRWADGTFDPDHGRHGTVVRTPDQEATPGSGVPSSTYAVQFEGSIYPRGAILPEYVEAAR